jgi:hypothetical protein
MATAYTNQTPYPNQPYSPVPGCIVESFSCDISKLVASFPGFIINDTVNLVRMPDNLFELYDFYVDLCALDSSTGVVESLGDNAPDATHGMAGAGGFMTGLTLGRSTTAGTVRAGGTGFVHGAIPFIYSIPAAQVPAIGLWFMLKITTAPTGTAQTTGIISGWVAYTALAPLENATQTGSVKPL